MDAGELQNREEPQVVEVESSDPLGVEVEDPGNVGALVRTGLAAGAAAFVRLARVPLRVSAASVNWGTSSRPSRAEPTMGLNRARFNRWARLSSVVPV